MFLSQHNYTFCIPPGLAKVYPPHPNHTANYTTPKYAKPQRPNKLNFPFTSPLGDPLLLDPTRHILVLEEGTAARDAASFTILFFGPDVSLMEQLL